MARPWVIRSSRLTQPDTMRRIRNVDHETLSPSSFSLSLCLSVSCTASVLFLFVHSSHSYLQCCRCCCCKYLAIEAASSVERLPVLQASCCKLSCTQTHTHTSALTAVACCVWVKLVSARLCGAVATLRRLPQEQQLTCVLNNPSEI